MFSLFFVEQQFWGRNNEQRIEKYNIKKIIRFIEPEIDFWLEKCVQIQFFFTVMSTINYKNSIFDLMSIVKLLILSTNLF